MRRRRRLLLHPHGLIRLAGAIVKYYPFEVPASFLLRRSGEFLSAPRPLCLFMLCVLCVVLVSAVLWFLLCAITCLDKGRGTVLGLGLCLCISGYVRNQIVGSRRRILTESRVVPVLLLG